MIDVERVRWVGDGKTNDVADWCSSSQASVRISPNLAMLGHCFNSNITTGSMNRLVLVLFIVFMTLTGACFLSE